MLLKMVLDVESGQTVGNENVGKWNHKKGTETGKVFHIITSYTFSKPNT